MNKRSVAIVLIVITYLASILLMLSADTLLELAKLVSALTLSALVGTALARLE